MICEKLLDYNLVDVEGLVLLNEEFGLIEDQFEQAQLVVAPPEDGIYTSKMHDHDMIKDFRNEMVFDTKYQNWKREPLKGKKQIGEKFLITLKELEDQAKRRGLVVEYNSLEDIHKVGGYVPPPLRAGTFVWVCVIDFNKQYPNAIMSSNAGVRTLVEFVEDLGDKILGYSINEKGEKFLGEWDKKDLIETPIAYFRKDVLSVNRKKFQKWLRFRVEAQKRAKEYLKKVQDQDDPLYKLLDGKQFRIKIFTNGGFGIMGYPKDRNYSQIIFNSCTLMCQDLTMNMIKIINDLGYDTVGGDTDSCFPILHADNLEDAIKEAKWLASEVNKRIDKYLDEVYNIQEHTMTVDVETISDKFIVKAAKNYVKRNLYRDGVILEEPQLEVKGIEMKKSNTSRLASDMQQTILNILLDSQTIKEDFELLMNVLDKNIHKLPWDYVAPKGAINNDMDHYKEGHYNSRGAKNARKYFNKHILPGENPFILPFKEFPKKLNGHFVSPYKRGESFVLSFDKEDIQKIQEAGFIPDWEDLKRSQLKMKSDPFLSLLDTDFYKAVAQTKVSDDMQL